MPPENTEAGVTADHIETPEEVPATIRAALELIDPEHAMPCTNCGMAPIPFDTTRRKLVALGAVARLVRSAL